MTKYELKQTIDDYLGLVSQVEDDYRDTSAKLIYFSPSGIKLFDLDIGDYGDGWRFGSNSRAVPESWKTLCHIHEGEKL